MSDPPFGIEGRDLERKLIEKHQNKAGSEEVERAPAQAGVEAASAGGHDRSVAAELPAPAGGAASAKQPELDLTSDPVRSSNADPVFMSQNSNKWTLGPISLQNTSRGTHSDYSFSAAGSSMIQYAYTAAGTGIATAVTGEVLANPDGHDLLWLGGGVGVAVLAIGIGINAIRLARGRRKR